MKKILKEILWRKHKRYLESIGYGWVIYIQLNIIILLLIFINLYDI